MMDIGNNRTDEYRIKKWSKNRPCIKLKGKDGVVIHGTANTGRGADAKANIAYFGKGIRYGSTQYVVDGKVEASVMGPDEVAWHVGARTYTALGNKIAKWGYSPNYFLHGIEMTVNRDSEFKDVILNTLDLASDIMIKYDYDMSKVYRHRDITGKNCPDFFANDDEWNEFKEQLEYIWKQKLDRGIVNLDFPEDDVKDYVEVTSKYLNIRKGPSLTYDKIDYEDKTFSNGDIAEVKEITNGWAYVIGEADENQEGWISLHYTEEATAVVPEYKYDKENQYAKIINIDPDDGWLNIRETPNTSKPPIGRYDFADVVQVFEKYGRWYRTEDGWIHGYYAELMTVRREIEITERTEIYESMLCEELVAVIEPGTTVLVFDSEEEEGFLKTKMGYMKID